MNTTRIAIVAAVTAAVAVGLAGAASAEPLNGSYTETLLSLEPHLKTQITASPCGPDCIHLQRVGPTASVDLHLQGDNWVGTHPTYFPDVTCASTLNVKSLVFTDECGRLGVSQSQLTKDG